MNDCLRAPSIIETCVESNTVQGNRHPRYERRRRNRHPLRERPKTDRLLCISGTCDATRPVLLSTTRITTQWAERDRCPVEGNLALVPVLHYSAHRHETSWSISLFLRQTQRRSPTNAKAIAFSCQRRASDGTLSLGLTVPFERARPFGQIVSDVRGQPIIQFSARIKSTSFP